MAMILKVKLRDFPFYTASKDGIIERISSGKRAPVRYSDDTGREKVRLSTEKQIGKKDKSKTIYLDEIIARTFLPEPKEDAILIHINRNTKDSASRNLKWVYIFDNDITEEVDYSLAIDDIKDNNVTDHNPIKYTGNKNTDSSDSESINDELTDENNSDDEMEVTKGNPFDEEIEDFPRNSIPDHEPLFKEFQMEEVEYDLSDTVEMNNKLWKTAKYKHFKIADFLISEDMELYSKNAKRIVQDDDYNMTYSNGEKRYRLTILGKLKRTSLRDILASSFLRVPDEAITSVHKNWNSNDKRGRYFDQPNHYTNLRWLTRKDFKKLKGAEKIIISSQGDLYSIKKGTFKMFKTVLNKNGSRRVRFKLNPASKSTVNLFALTALAFVNRPNEKYIYVTHKDDDIGNDHYRNLEWINTLSGIHTDGNRYYEYPGFPGYALSESNFPYHFKRGKFRRMALHKDEKGYLSTTANKNGKQLRLRFNRLVAAIRNLDFDASKPTDHKNQIRDDNNPINLRSATISENNLNRGYFKKGREIVQLDRFEKFVNMFENCAEAEKCLGKVYTKRRIAECAATNNIVENGKSMYKDYIWRYKEKREIYTAKPGEIFQILNGNFQGVDINYPKYKISNLGNIVNIEKGFLKTINSKNRAYPETNFSNEGEQKMFGVHILVALVFVPGRTEERSSVNHKDEIKTNFLATNLEWSTGSENTKYSSYKISIPVKKISIQTGEILAVYNSRVEAAISMGKNPKSAGNIGQVCNGETSHAFGFHWKDIPFEEIEKYPELIINQRKAMHSSKETSDSSP
jgi:hypothetical protein